MRRLHPASLLLLSLALTCPSAAFFPGLDTLQRLVPALARPANPDQIPLPAMVDEDAPRVGKSVAIIGAGSAGTSTSYYLRRYLENSTSESAPVNITLYERSSHFGGRSTTVPAYNDSSIPIELGASIFVTINHNLISAVEELGLDYSTNVHGEKQEDDQETLGIYDGSSIIFSFPEGKWWTYAKLIWRYGPMAPYRTRKLTESVVGKFLNFYKAPVFPFSSVGEAVEKTGLAEAVGSTGLQYLEENGITGGFPLELIQASTRVNYGQNLGLIHGVETMVCMATDGAVSVAGGNYQIFERMALKSTSDIRLETRVTALEKTSSGLWKVFSTGPEGKSVQLYDEVVVAAPWQFTDLSVSPELEKTPDEIPYVTLHVTLIASPLLLDGEAFGMKKGELAPQVILTTLNESQREDSKHMVGTGSDAAGASGFFSISTLRSVQRPIANSTATTTEYIYKVFSPEAFTDDDVARILGIGKPYIPSKGEEEFAEGEADGKGKSPEELKAEALSWVYRHVWKSYPYEYPRVTFEEAKLDEGLWYTAGMESFISTMETSSLMGMDVARLIADKWEAGKTARVEKETVGEQTEGEPKTEAVAGDLETPSETEVEVTESSTPDAETETTASSTPLPETDADADPEIAAKTLSDDWVVIDMPSDDADPPTVGADEVVTVIEQRPEEEARVEEVVREEVSMDGDGEMGEGELKKVKAKL